MGIPGILKEIGKGQRVALAKLAVEHLEKTQRPLRIAIDAAIWNFQSQAGQGGKNPALRTLYYRLLKLLALPIHPLFVYDGKNKPSLKRGKAVSRWGTCIANETSKKLIRHFSFPHHTAPGEAEAECALLQRKGIVDMVMSQDGDAIMFGSGVTLRDWSKEGTKGNKTPTHVNVLDLPRLKERSGLDPEGMILVALLSGGDYDQNGVAGFGAGLACEAARAGFGADMLQLVRQDDETGLKEWRERLQYELGSNESGHFRKKHKTVRIPDSFPDRTIVDYYINPAISQPEDLNKLEKQWAKSWEANIEVSGLRDYVAQTFDWQYKPGAWKFVRTMAPSLLASKLLAGTATSHVTSVDHITERRQHFVNDGIPELRVKAVPADIVGIDLDAEEDSPEYLARLAEEHESDEAVQVQEVTSTQQEADEDPPGSQSPTKSRKPPPWSPYVTEKIWLPETVVQLGVPAVVEDWHQLQRDILADPKKFASRKCKKPTTKPKTQPQSGTIKQYLTLGKVGQDGLYPSQGMPYRNPLGLLANQIEKLPPPVQQTEHRKQNQAPDMKQMFKVSKPSTMAFPVINSDSTMPAKSSKSRSQHVAGDGLEVPLAPRHLGSCTDPISLTSSPMTKEPVHSAPDNVFLAPKRSTEEEALVANTTDELDLPPTVTKRTKRAVRRRRPSDTGEEPQTPTPKRHSIENFFSPSQRKFERARTLPTTVAELEAELPADLSTGLELGFTSKRLYAIPRESLPGTWKDIDIEEVVMSAKSKRRHRVSCIDLTGD